jgi:hypothetical protein
MPKRKRLQDGTGIVMDVGAPISGHIPPGRASGPGSA